MKGSKWIPIYGMFTKEANEIPNGVHYEHLHLGMVFYHGVIIFGCIFSIMVVVFK
jgi:hypothetical protein